MVNYYKKNNSIGLKDKEKDNKQVMSFGAGSGLSEEGLRKWADKLLPHLDGGMSVGDAKAWIDDQLAPS